ncbi:hypothetical protein JCM10207_002460 [Rhodosporidiobolus poonsookiae]
MAPLDPGPTIRWSSHPAYTHSLLDHITQLDNHQHQHALFQSAQRRTNAWKAAKQTALEQVTRATFTAGGDSQREKKQQDSVNRRLQQLGKDYTAAITALNARGSVSLRATVARLAPTHPFLRPLRALLHDCADFLAADDGDEVDDELERFEEEGAGTEEEDEDEEEDGEWRYGHGYREEDEEEDRMEVDHAPLAGPAYPNPALPHHAPHLPVPAAPAPHLPHPPPAAHAQTHGQVDDDALCPVCSVDLSSFPSPTEGEAHLRTCLERAAGGAAPRAEERECPVCGLEFSAANRPTQGRRGARGAGAGAGWTEDERDRHVDECCRRTAGAGGAEGAAGGGAGGGGETLRETKRGGRREHVVFIADEKTLPRNETGEALECVMCLDDFLPSTSESLARLSCYCIYHERCIKAYWAAKPGRWCPTHREMDEVGEVEMSAA